MGNRGTNTLARNKRSISLNLKTDEGRQVFLDLAKTADVVIEGFRPGVVKRLGVDYETVRGLNERIVYCSLSGYGQDGPYANMVGHDINYISMAGALGMMGWPGTPPALPLNLLADYAGGGLYAAFSILAALVSRSQTGKGQYIDVAMTDGVISLLAPVAGQYFNTGQVPRPGNSLLTGSAPHYNSYETSDGKWLSIGSLEPWFYENLLHVLGCEEYLTQQNNADLWPAMVARFRAEFRKRTRDEWLKLLTEVEICVAPVYELDEVFDDPHVKHRKMVIEVDHPEFGKLRQVGVGAKFSDTPGSVRSLAPSRGEHTDAVLRGLHRSEDEIAALRASGAVA
jgi:crotonobetainyl-CoA:carnitine CoA-transferase CaiB-like acyl-CoA transferase